MAEVRERCSFEFDPEAWEREHEEYCFVNPDGNEDAPTGNADGVLVWRCPHEAVDGQALCAFHLSPGSDAKPDAETVADAFLEIANGEREALVGDGPRPARFIAAEFESLDLDTERVGDGRVIDLRHVRVGGAEWDVETVEAEPLDARGIRVRGTWDCDGVTFGGDVLSLGAEFGEDVSLDGAEFGGSVDFSGAEFGGNAGFSDAGFVGHAEFSGATFGGAGRFGGTEFGGSVGFIGAEFRGGARFQDAEFGPVMFDRADFDRGAMFHRAGFGGPARFRRTVFDLGVAFDGAEFGGPVEFTGTEFTGRAVFSGVEFENGATFGSDGWFPVSPFQGTADFSGVTARAPLRFVDEYGRSPGLPYTFLGEVNFSGADIPEATFSGVSFREAPTFERADLTRADLSGSRFHGATFEGADLTRANLSETNVAGANFDDALLSRASLYGTDFTNAELYGARMEGAHVSDHTDFGVRNQPGRTRSGAVPFRGPWPDVRYDERNPAYDQFAGDDGEERENISDHTRAAAVYAEIERVAETNADSELASRCYLWRKDMQRKRYWSDGGDGNRSEPLRWFRSAVANVFVRYGESPWRVTGVAGLIIVVCALLYHLFDLIEYGTSPSQSVLLGTVGEIAPGPAVTFLDALYFSTLTFSTLGMGTFQPSGQWGRALAIFETLSGVVLLALLVFVFGRRATR